MWYVYKRRCPLHFGICVKQIDKETILKLDLIIALDKTWFIAVTESKWKPNSPKDVHESEHEWSAVSALLAGAKFGKEKFGNYFLLKGHHCFFWSSELPEFMKKNHDKCQPDRRITNKEEFITFAKREANIELLIRPPQTLQNKLG